MRIGNDRGLRTNGNWVSEIGGCILPQLLTHDVFLCKRSLLSQQTNSPASLRLLITNSDEEGQNFEEKINLIREWRTAAFLQGVNAITQTLWRPIFLNLLISIIFLMCKRW